MNYLSIENISKSYGLKTLFTDITFGIEKGQKIAFLAKNGTGKSTLLKILGGIEKHDQGVVAFNKDIHVEFLSQDPILNLDHTVFEEVFTTDNPKLKAVKEYEQALQNPDDGDAFADALQKMTDLNAWDIESKVKSILSVLKLDKLEWKVAGLSGGQKKRVALAKVLINEPDFLILDEPTNHLDLDTVEWLEEFLAKESITLLMVTHDRYFLERVCNEIIELENGEIYRYKGNYSYYLEKREERKEQEQATREKDSNLFRKELDWVRRQPQARATKAKYRVDAFHDLKSKLSKTTNEDGLKLDIISARQGKKILELKKLHKVYDDGYMIMDNFSYTFKKNEKVGILGENGVGKSTFLNMITGKEPITSGEIIKGETVKIAYYHQDGLKLDGDKKVIEVVREVAEVIPMSNGKTISASQMLERFLFGSDQQYQYVSTLSGGERKRLYLLMTLMENPNFLILDEPTNDLDLLTLNILEDFLADFAGCLMLVSHDRYFLDKIVDHIFIFEGKGIVRDYNGTCSEYLELKAIEEGERKKELQQEKKEQKEMIPTKPAIKEIPKKTYQEKMELEILEKEIPKLEEEKKHLEKILAKETDTDKIVQLSQEFGKFSADLDEKSMRWLELSEKS